MSDEESIDSKRSRIAMVEIRRKWIAGMNNAIDSLPYYPDDPEEMVDCVVELAKALVQPIGDKFLDDYLELQAAQIENIQTFAQEDLLVRTSEEADDIKKDLHTQAGRRFEHACLIREAQSLSRRKIIDRLRKMNRDRKADWDDFFCDIEHHVRIEEFCGSHCDEEQSRAHVSTEHAMRAPPNTEQETVYLVSRKDIGRAFDDTGHRTVHTWVSADWFPAKYSETPELWRSDEVSRAMKERPKIQKKQTKMWSKVCNEMSILVEGDLNTSNRD